jgi:hypothetical protein
MKSIKTISILLILFFAISCEKSQIYKEYLSIHEVWDVNTVIIDNKTIDKDTLTLKYLDFTKCVLNNKKLKKESLGCIAWINTVEKNGVLMSYRVQENNSMIIDVVSNSEVSAKQDTELRNLLLGTWSYQVLEGTKLKLKKTTSSNTKYKNFEMLFLKRN